MKKVLLFLFLMTTTASASCDAVNLYDSPSSPFHRMPVYDQGELNTCYAYTATQMLDYHRATKPLINPLWAALVHKMSMPLHWNPDNLEFSRLTWVFRSLEKQGICKADVVARAIDKLRNGNKALTDEDLLFFFQSLWDEFHSTTNYQKAYDTIASDQYFSEKIKFSLIDKFRFIESRSKSKRLEALKAEVFSECTGDNIERFEIPARESSAAGFASNDKIKKIIEENLDQGIPLGLGYCYFLLPNGTGYHGLSFKPRMLAMAMNNEKCGAHYSMIVAKRPSQTGSKCEYLVRNTFGSTWSTDKFKCENGGCWVDSEDIAENTFDLTHLKK